MPHLPMFSYAGHDGESDAGAAAGAEAHVPRGTVPFATGGPVRPGSVGADERAGLWWCVEGHVISYYPLGGSQWPPIATHSLTDDGPCPAVVDAACIAVLDGCTWSSSGNAGPFTAVVLHDLRIVVFSQGTRIDVAPPENAPLDQVPASVASIGETLVVVTQSGRIFSILLRQGALSQLEADASPFWPTCAKDVASAGGDSGVRAFLDRVRKSLSHDMSLPAEAPRAGGAEAEAIVPPIHEVELCPAPEGSDAAFSVLASGPEGLAFYVYPRQKGAGLESNAAVAASLAHAAVHGYSRELPMAAELVWALPMNELFTPSPGVLLRCKLAMDEGGLLILRSSEDVVQYNQYASSAGQALVLEHLDWSFWRDRPCRTPQAIADDFHPSEATAHQTAVVGRMFMTDATSKSDPAAAFLMHCGTQSMVAVRVSGLRYQLSSVSWRPHDGFRVLESSILETGVLTMARLDLDTATERIAVVTTQGLLDYPLEGITEPSRGVGATLEALPDVDVPEAQQGQRAVQVIQHAYLVYNQGEEQVAKLTLAHASRMDPTHLLNAVSERTRNLIDLVPDASGPRWRGVKHGVMTRYHIHDKARELHMWVAFLDEAGFWTRFGTMPGAVELRQRVSEACERVAALSCLREMDDHAPEVFAAAIRQNFMRNRRTLGAAMPPDEEAAPAFYGHASQCEDLLADLAAYPRSLPLGSSDVIEAVLFANRVAMNLIDAALERRAQIVTSFPKLLPAPDLEDSRRHLPCAAYAPRALGTAWLVSPNMQRMLEHLRAVSLEVLPPALARGELVDQMAVRVADSLRDMCRATLQAAHASYGTLHCDGMAKLRHSILDHMVEAEAALKASDSPSGPQRSLLLAEEFEDFEAIVNLTAHRDVHRLDEHMAESEVFCKHALAHCLRHPRLQPFFFRATRKFDIPTSVVEELLMPYPELRWTLEVQGLEISTDSAALSAAFAKVQQRAAGMVQKERHSAAKRDGFAALCLIAHVASRRGRAAELPASDDLPERVADIACLGRLQRVCLNFGKGRLAGGLTVGSKRPSPDEPPATVEDCLLGLCGCVRKAIPDLRAERAELSFVDDVARLARIVERGLLERDVDFSKTGLGSHPAGAFGSAAAVDVVTGQVLEDENTLASLRKLWSEIILADVASWKRMLETSIAHREHNLAVLRSTVFYRALAWKDAGSPHKATALPRGADLEILCDCFKELQAIAPAIFMAPPEVERSFKEQSGEQVHDFEAMVARTAGLASLFGSTDAAA